MKHIKTALIGFGYRGKQLLRLLRTIESYKIVGIADINGCGDSNLRALPSIGARKPTR